jgi:hypothetical protein
MSMRIPSVTLNAVCLLVSACGGSVATADWPAPLPVVREQLDICTETHTSLECHRRIEARQLSGRRDKGVFRIADTLRLGTRAGIIDLIDIPAANDSAVRFTYVAELTPRGHHLIAGHLYEGTAYLLVSPDARRAWLDRLPLFSPDGARFAVASNDAIQIGTNRLQIWMLQDGGFQLEWSMEPTDWRPSDVEWDGSHAMLIHRISIGGKDLTPVRALFGTDGWYLTGLTGHDS